MKNKISTVLTIGLFAVLTSTAADRSEAARRRALTPDHVRAIPVRAASVPGVVAAAVPRNAVASPCLTALPAGNLAELHDFPGGVAYGRAAYRTAVPLPAAAAPRAMRRVVRYGRSKFTGPRGYAAVISPWPLVPVTTPSQPFGVGVVPPAEVVAWQSPAGYFYRANYRSAVMRSGLPMACPQPSGMEAMEIDAVELAPPGSLNVPLETIPVPPAENRP